jgi:ATP-dependent RNA helicase DeaD
LESQTNSFDSLSVSQPTLDALAEMGYSSATAVQWETIPMAQAGHDLVVMSRTGTGKTAAFGVPITEKVEVGEGVVQAVVLTPTRELTNQVNEELHRIGKHAGVRVAAIYGGESLAGQIQAIEAGAHVVVGTPGRVLDHLKRKTLRLDSVRTLVLDEADKMLDMGFAQEMTEIMRFMPEERQTLLFSATIPLGIRGMIYSYLSDPKWILLSEDFAYIKEVEHTYIIAPQMQKEHVLYKVIEHDQPTSSMIFCNTRGEVRMVAAFLARQGLPVAMISSDLVQRKREQVMARFRSGTIRHLVATDVAARGIDIEDLSHVFIYSTPESPELYIHRAGRTGRIGKSGHVISLVSASDLVSFNRLVNRYHLDVGERAVPTDEKIRDKKIERIFIRLDKEASLLSDEELAEMGDVADVLAEHPDRRRLLAYLLRHDFGPPESMDEPEEAAQTPKEATGGVKEARESKRGNDKRRGRRRRPPRNRR